MPIFYQGRMTNWHLHDKELDVVFDQWFSDEPEDKVEELKRRGVTKGDLARFEPRIQLIALDLWTHYRKHVHPDGFKAQVVAIDRLACVAYKKALEVKPSYTPALYNIAFAYRDGGDKAAAKSAFQRYLAVAGKRTAERRFVKAAKAALSRL